LTPKPPKWGDINPLNGGKINPSTPQMGGFEEVAGFGSPPDGAYTAGRQGFREM